MAVPPDEQLWPISERMPRNPDVAAAAAGQLHIYGLDCPASVVGAGQPDASHDDPGAGPTRRPAGQVLGVRRASDSDGVAR